MRTSGRTIGLVLALGACGGGSTTTAEQFLARLLPAWCEREAECGYLPDPGTCLEIMTGSPSGATVTEPVLAAVADGRLRFDAAVADACLAGIAATPCGERAAFGELRCGQALVPAQAAGRPCYHDVQVCVAGTVCEFPAGCTPGTCCAGTCTANAAAAIPPGGACDGTVACAPDSACIGGTCRYPSTDGDPCTSSCAGALVCDGGTCRAATPLAVVDAPCATSLDCQPDLYCAWDDAQGADVCKPWRLAGEACDANEPTTRGCPPWLFCDATTQQCAARARAGNPCSATLPCLALGPAGDPCFDGTCREPDVDGAYCDSDAQCLSRVCTASVCAETLVCP